ncbi:MAG: phosphoribosylamine--glycine ligase [Acidobacteriaceae bacterium]
MRVLILGGGGREHAIAWKLRQEGHEIFAIPGNPGIAEVGTCLGGAILLKDNVALASVAVVANIDFTIVGPEAPLANGIVDHFNKHRLPVFGPTKAAAEIETSKEFCCHLLESAGVAIPKTTYFQSFGAMKGTASAMKPPFVIKKSGLASGKGAEVIKSGEDFLPAMARLEKLEAEETWLIQRMAVGPEMSYFVLTDGEDFAFLGSAQDYKPLYRGGPNTGGMGGFSPHPLLTSELKQTIDDQIVEPTIRTMAGIGRQYKGVLYFQLMITDKGPVVIEINCRFGDPETQLMMPLFDFKLLPLLIATTKAGSLQKLGKRWPVSKDKTVGIVMSSRGYPGTPETGSMILGLPEEAEEYLVFQAGTEFRDNVLVNSGGRVLTAVGKGETYVSAKVRALEAVRGISFIGAYYRDDIADEVIESQA